MMIEEVPVCYEWLILADDGWELRDDAPQDMKDAYEKHLQEEKQKEHDGLETVWEAIEKSKEFKAVSEEVRKKIIGIFDQIRSGAEAQPLSREIVRLLKES